MVYNDFDAHFAGKIKDVRVYLDRNKRNYLWYFFYQNVFVYVFMVSTEF